MLTDGRAKSLDQSAKWLNLSKTRLEQICNLLYLSPKIQEEIISGDPRRLAKLSEYNLRSLTQEIDWAKQTGFWQKALA